MRRAYFRPRRLPYPLRIVATEAHLTDEDGTALKGDAIPEAAAVEVGERRTGIVHVRWGPTEGWLPAASVRVLP